MTESITKTDTPNTGITDERFSEIFEAVILSEDLREAVGKPSKQIEEALYAKLDYPAVSGIDDFFDLLGDEAKEALIALIESVLNETECKQFHTGDKEARVSVLSAAKKRINADSTLKNLYIRAFAAAKSVKNCVDDFKENDGYGDLGEFGELLLEAVSNLNKLRVTHDVIPLLQRGLYATEVREALDYWDKNCGNQAISSDEGAWQKELTKRIAVLQRALGGKVVLLNAQAHVGAEGLDGKGDRITDFMLQHANTKNVFLVEIKTPDTPLLGIAYRNTYALSDALSGSISQVLLQRHDAMINFYTKHFKTQIDFNVAAPRCIVVAGNLDKEVGTDVKKGMAFEMQRQAIEANVRIITFDELYKDFSNFHLLN